MQQLACGGEIMKFGIRTPSLKKRIAARTSVKRMIRHNLGVKAPKGLGWVTDPKKAAYNRAYNRTTKGVGCSVWIVALLGLGILLTSRLIA